MRKRLDAVSTEVGRPPRRAACPGHAGEARPEPSTGPGRGFHAPPGGRPPARSEARVQGGRRGARGDRVGSPAIAGPHRIQPGPDPGGFRHLVFGRECQCRHVPPGPRRVRRRGPPSARALPRRSVKIWSAAACRRFGFAEQVPYPIRLFPQSTAIGQAKAAASCRTPRARSVASKRVGPSGENEDGEHHDTAAKTHAELWSAAAFRRFGAPNRFDTPSASSRSLRPLAKPKRQQAAALQGHGLLHRDGWVERRIRGRRTPRYASEDPPIRSPMIQPVLSLRWPQDGIWNLNRR